MNIINGIDPQRALRMLCLAVIVQHEVGPLPVTPVLKEQQSL